MQMKTTHRENIIIYKFIIVSAFLKRSVPVQVYFPGDYKLYDALPLLLINDGQNMEEVGLKKILHKLYDAKEITPLCCVAI